jgi:hypothetical protein
MRVTPDVTIGVLATALQKEIDEKTTFLAMLKAVMAQGVSPSTPYGAGGGGSVVPITSGKRRRGKKPTIAAASLEILRAAGRPLHGLREILPALEAQGIKIKHKAGLATVLMRTGEVERTSPGTFAVRGGAASAG